MRKINKIIIHCSASDFGNAQRIREWHTAGEGNNKGNGWSDIGYHYVINNGKVFKDDKINQRVQDGFIEKGRDDSIAGAHTQGQNSNSIGICLVGNKDFTEEQFNSLNTLLDSLLKAYNLTKNDVYGHYNFSSKTCPNFDVQEFMKKR